MEVMWDDVAYPWPLTGVILSYHELQKLNPAERAWFLTCNDRGMSEDVRLKHKAERRKERTFAIRCSFLMAHKRQAQP